MEKHVNNRQLTTMTTATQKNGSRHVKCDVFFSDNWPPQIKPQGLVNCTEYLLVSFQPQTSLRTLQEIQLLE